MPRSDFRFWGAIVTATGRVRSVMLANSKESATELMMSDWTPEKRSLHTVEPLTIGIDKS